jgi:hypothetical protein
MTATEFAQSTTERAGVEAWASAWRRALPVLALIGPGSWFVAAMIRAAGIGTLDGDLDWVSAPEGLVMSLGASFFVATYVMLGSTVARRAVRTGIAVTGLGLVGTGAFSGIAWFRVFMAKFTDEGLDPDAMNQAFRGHPRLGHRRADQLRQLRRVAGRRHRHPHDSSRATLDRSVLRRRRGRRDARPRRLHRARSALAARHRSVAPCDHRHRPSGSPSQLTQLGGTCSRLQARSEPRTITCDSAVSEQ